MPDVTTAPTPLAITTLPPRGHAEYFGPLSPAPVLDSIFTDNGVDTYQYAGTGPVWLRPPTRSHPTTKPHHRGSRINPVPALTWPHLRKWQSGA